MVVDNGEIVRVFLLGNGRAEGGVSLLLLLPLLLILLLQLLLLQLLLLLWWRYLIINIISTKHNLFHLPTLFFWANIHGTSTSWWKVLRYVNDLFIVQHTPIDFEGFAWLTSPLSLFGQICVDVVVLLGSLVWNATGEGAGLAGLVKSLLDVVFYHVLVFCWLEENFISAWVNLCMDHLLLPITIMICLLWYGLCHHLISTWTYLDA